MSGVVKWAQGLEKLLVPIDSIQQHPDNPNNGDVEDIIESIKVNGFNTVLTVDSKTGYITAGNHRWQALHALGATQVPVVFVEDQHDGEGTRYLIADNRIGQKAVINEAELVDLLKGLAQSEMGLIGTGYTEGEYLQLIEQLNEIEEMPMGAGEGISLSGVYQVIIEFDNPTDRDEVFADLADSYPEQVRTANL